MFICSSDEKTRQNLDLQVANRRPMHAYLHKNGEPVHLRETLNLNIYQVYSVEKKVLEEMKNLKNVNILPVHISAAKLAKHSRSHLPKARVRRYILRL